MPDEPKLSLVQEAAKANPFNAEALRLSLNGAPVAKKLLTTVPVRKPSKEEFFRVHTDPEFSLTTMLLKYDGDFYLVLPSMVSEVGPDGQPFTLYTCINRVGVVTLWPVRIPGPDEVRSNGWWDSAHEAAEMAKRKWLRLSSNKSLAAYEISTAEIRLPEPEWPEKTMDELLELAFKKQVIASPDSDILKMLKGRI
ncbi:hypothetical protein I6F15_00095 [Bradyrhizobium sp. BRP14]|nr:hypothetical protein [Bradyrhizobium sp. BRP14]